TGFSIGAESTTLALDAGTRGTGIELYGRLLVTGQIRDDAACLEVFDATPLLDRTPATSFTPAGNSLAKTQVAPYAPTIRSWADVSVQEGRVFVGVHEDNSGSNPSP